MQSFNAVTLAPTVQIPNKKPLTIQKPKKSNKRTTKAYRPQAQPSTHLSTQNIATAKSNKRECNRLLAVAKTCERDRDWCTALEYFEEAATMVREIISSTGEDLSSLLLGAEKKIQKLTLKAATAAATTTTTTATTTTTSHIQASTLSWSVLGTGTAALPDGFAIPSSHYDKLFPHQQRGVEWMWSLYRNVSGGILADDMGLGKTVQVVTLIRGLCTNANHRVSLVVSPVSVVPQWKKEFDRWAPELNVVIFHNMSKTQKTHAMANILQTGGVIITTYGHIRSQQSFYSATDEDFQTAKKLAVCQRCDPSSNEDEEDNENEDEEDKLKRRQLYKKRMKRRLKHFQYACTVLDEGHIIKNHTTQISQAVRTLPCRQRLLLTGTPIQNHLKEIWSLFDWVTDGHILGTVKEFNATITCKIELANQKNATRYEKKAGKEASEQLALIIKPLMLRRTKDEVFGATASKEEEDTGPDTSKGGPKGGKTVAPGATTATTKPKVGLSATKTDVVVWIPLGKGVQRDIYYDFLQSPQVKRVLNETGSPLVAIDVLRKVCQHPSLLNKKMQTTSKRTVGKGHAEEQNNAHHANNDKNPNRIDWMLKYPKMTSTRASSKLIVLLKLLTSLKDHGHHRTLIFTSTKLMLNLIEKALPMINTSYLRIDGGTGLKDRQVLVDEFNMNPNIDVMLLTVGVGGVGLTLTGADRVILFDPSWNPSIDRQAVDRCYRIGQLRNVICYRFITCGTVEESMYRRQVFKDAVSSTVMNASLSKAWSSRNELRRLFSLDTPNSSDMCDQVHHLKPQKVLQKGHDALEQSLQKLGAYGISYHELVCQGGLTGKQKKGRRHGPPTFGGGNRNLKKKINGRRKEDEMLKAMTKGMERVTISGKKEIKEIKEIKETKEPVEAGETIGGKKKKKNRKNKKKTKSVAVRMFDMEAEEDSAAEEKVNEMEKLGEGEESKAVEECEEDQDKSDIVVVVDEEQDVVVVEDHESNEEEEEDEWVDGEEEEWVNEEEEEWVNEEEEEWVVEKEVIVVQDDGSDDDGIVAWEENDTNQVVITLIDEKDQEIDQQEVKEDDGYDDDGNSDGDGDDDGDDEENESIGMDNFVDAVGKTDRCSTTSNDVPQQNSEPKCCRDHWKQMMVVFPDPTVVKCTVCRCHVNETEVSKYETLLLAADKTEDEFEEFQRLCDAIEIIDDDPNLHGKILLLGEKMGLLEHKD